LAEEALLESTKAADGAARNAYLCIAEQFKRLALAAQRDMDHRQG